MNKFFVFHFTKVIKQAGDGIYSHVHLYAKNYHSTA